MAKTIKILLVDDHHLVRRGIRGIVEKAGMEVIGEASTGDEAVRMSRELSPDVILMDVHMPGTSGIDATRKICRYNPDTKVMALSAFSGEPYPSNFFKAGAAGYLTKGCDEKEMVQAIRVIYSGQRYISPSLAQRTVLQRMSNRGDSPFAKLSKREMEVALLVAAGHKPQKIAELLHIEQKSVNSHRYHIFKKVGVETDVSLTLLAMQHDLIGTPDVIPS